MSNRDPDFDMDYLEGILLGLHFAVIFIIATLKPGNFHSLNIRVAECLTKGLIAEYDC
jgi:hypothetical protein